MNPFVLSPESEALIERLLSEEPVTEPNPLPTRQQIDRWKGIEAAAASLLAADEAGEPWPPNAAAKLRALLVSTPQPEPAQQASSNLIAKAVAFVDADREHDSEWNANDHAQDGWRRRMAELDEKRGAARQRLGLAVDDWREATDSPGAAAEEAPPEPAAGLAAWAADRGPALATAIDGPPAAAPPEPARPEWVKIVNRREPFAFPTDGAVVEVIGWRDGQALVASASGRAARHRLNDHEWVPTSPPSLADALGATVVRQYTHEHAVASELARRSAPVAAPVDEPEPAAAVRKALEDPPCGTCGALDARKNPWCSDAFHVAPRAAAPAPSPDPEPVDELAAAIRRGVDPLNRAREIVDQRLTRHIKDDGARWDAATAITTNLDMAGLLAAPSPAPSPDPERREMLDERTIVGDSVASESNSWESLVAELTEAWATVEPGHRYTREHFSVDATQFVGHTPAKVHADALDVIVAKLPELLFAIDDLAPVSPEPPAAAGSPEPGDDGTPSDEELAKVALDAYRAAMPGVHITTWERRQPAGKQKWVAIAAAVRAALGEDR